MHRHLRSAGVDGVKVDVQSGLTVMASPYGGYTELARSYNASLERSVKENFPGNVLINCMCHRWGFWKGGWNENVVMENCHFLTIIYYFNDILE